MLICGEKNSFVTLGSSCILDFQLRSINQQNEKHFKVKTGLFDWNIITPDASIKLMNDLNDRTFLEKLANLNNLRINNGKLENTLYNGIFFWHEDAQKVLSDKDSYIEFFLKQERRYKNFMEYTLKSNVIYLWSNFQPNLFQASKNQVTDPNDFFLDGERYDALSNCIADKYKEKKPNIYFLVHNDAVDMNLIDRSNVITVCLDRSSDYQGPEGLLRKIIEEEKMFDLNGVASNTQEIH